MPVPAEMRAAETEIDRSIAALPIWKTPQETLLRMILEFYRDAIEMVFLRTAFGHQVGDSATIESSLGQEQYLHGGVLQALKWTMEFSPLCEDGPSPDAEVVHELIGLGHRYELLVDVLKMANHDRVTTAVNDAGRTITVYEGGDLTGADAQLIAYQHSTLPLYAQTPLIADDDQLTAKWTAGDFRRLANLLAAWATDLENEQVVMTLGGKETPLLNRPVVLEIKDTHESAQQAVLEDLTLTLEKAANSSKWRLTSWRDIPLVMVGSRRLAVSNIVKSLAGRACDDYMLRVAARVDSNQYSKVSGLRENRMIELCRATLETHGWAVRPRLKLTDPPRELDLYATKEGGHLVVQLKSTLRPETPWEVLNRNKELLKGIEHTAEAVHRFPAGTIGIVVTDGYRGDYNTWAQALACGVMVGTMQDVDDIARDPMSAHVFLKSRAGFDERAERSPAPDRQLELAGWTLRLIDAPAPSQLSRDHQCTQEAGDR